MKKPFFLLLLSSFIFILISSCDKIEEDNYIVYSGAKAMWEEGSGVSDKTQRTLIEKYTGVRCINCPTAEVTINEAVASMGGRLIAVAIHDSSLAFCRPIGNSPDLRTPVGQLWSTYFGVAALSQYPMALVGRNQNTSGWALFNPVDAVIANVNDALNQDNVIAMAVDADKKNDSVNVVVNLEYLESTAENLAVTIIVIEDGIIATQRFPSFDSVGYVHNHVLRDAITDPWGTVVDDGRGDNTNTPVAAGTKRRGNFTFAPNNSWNIANCHIVAFVSRVSDKRILNVAECEIE